MQKTIRLLKAHKHGGREVGAGAQIALDERRAAWLVEQGVAEYVARAPAARAALLTNTRATSSADAGGTAQQSAPAPSARAWGCCGGKR